MESHPTPAPEAELGTEEVLLRATLAVHREFELPGQLRRLLDTAVTWSDAGGGLALGPGDDEQRLIVLAQNPRGKRSHMPRIGAIDRGQAQGWFGDSPRLFEGLGPLVASAEPAAGPGPDGCWVVPLRAGERFLYLVLDRSSEPDPAARERVAALVRECEPALANGLRVRSMCDLVIKDDTANCFNRRYFESSLPDELARAGRFHSALSLIFLDMDNLKEVNNLYGHAAGSRSLWEVSQRIRSKIRRFDRLFRFGGDEFCIVLPETEWHGALEVAERVRDAIASRGFLIGRIDEPAGVRMTASLGIASYPLHARTKRGLVELADRAMQRVKRDTKDAVGIAEITGEEHGCGTHTERS